jgi:hypothetical protein
MDEGLERLLALAFETAPAREASAAIARVRESVDPAGEAVSYEIVLSDHPTFAHLTDEVVPRLVYHLACLGVRLPEASRVFLSVFAGDALHFVLAREALALVAERSGLDARALIARYGPREGPAETGAAGERQGPPLLLGPGPPKDP